MSNKNLVKMIIAVASPIFGCSANTSKTTPYESSTAEQRAHFKRVSLPLKAGTKIVISQGAFGCCTHNQAGFEYAWDFDVPYGTPVLAVDSGKVIQVWEPNQGGGCDKKFNDLAHNIKVVADDGTVAQYVHVSSKVRKGDAVRKGQVVGETANNGFLCTPQLHFNIFKDRSHIPENGHAETIPVLFEGLPDSGMAHEGFRGVAP